ncbi:TIGR04255 family protein [Rhodococcus erythropolis]|uniref:TIGR04255 family protein n=1 Tax=Rhodococcus erythropolis TaxID=1833 RepID=UPI0036DCAC4F
MSATTQVSPFADNEPGYIHLKDSPLVRTIAQIRFPELSVFMADEDGIASRVVAALSESYPLVSVDHEVAVTFSPQGASESQSGERLWRLRDADQTWQISFGRRFLSLDTSSYYRRGDFAERLTAAWNVLDSEIHSPFIERLGIRYVNHITSVHHVQRLQELVRPEIFGVNGSSVQDGELLSALSEAQYKFADNSAFNARWGLLLPGMTLDPGLPASSHKTWVLDMDSFRDYSAASRALDTFELEVRALAFRGYQFFRWAVTTEFLKTFGGEVE